MYRCRVDGGSGISTAVSGVPSSLAIARRILRRSRKDNAEIFQISIGQVPHDGEIEPVALQSTPVLAHAELISQSQSLHRRAAPGSRSASGRARRPFFAIRRAARNRPERSAAGRDTKRSGRRERDLTAAAVAENCGGCNPVQGRASDRLALTALPCHHARYGGTAHDDVG